MLQCCRQMRHDRGSKMPTIRQDRAQLMPDPTAQAGFCHRDGEVVLPQQLRHSLFILDLVGAKNGLAEALPHLRLQRVDEGGSGGCIGSFGSQAHVNLAQLHLRQQTNGGVCACFDQIVQGFINIALREPQAFERA